MLHFDVGIQAGNINALKAGTFRRCLCLQCPNVHFHHSDMGLPLRQTRCTRGQRSSHTCGSRRNLRQQCTAISSRYSFLIPFRVRSLNGACLPRGYEPRISCKRDINDLTHLTAVKNTTDNSYCSVTLLIPVMLVMLCLLLLRRTNSYYSVALMFTSVTTSEAAWYRCRSVRFMFSDRNYTNESRDMKINVLCKSWS